MLNLKKIQEKDFWYLVGLIASDGSLSKDGRHINITSKDYDFIDLLNRHFDFKLKIGIKKRGGGYEKKYFQLQIGSVTLYKDLLSIGLTPAKSLTLAALIVSQQEFPHFLRGVIDGDGCISTWINKQNGYNQWSLKITSAAPQYSMWLKEMIEKEFNVCGKIYKSQGINKKNPVYNIKFGKIASQIILEACYSNNYIALERKKIQAYHCMQSKNGWRRYKHMTVQ